MIALGSVIHDLVHPKVAMVGAENDQARDLLLKIYDRYVEGKDVRCSTWINCEIAKIADNAFVTNKISFVNDLGRLCEHLPHANIDEVTRIIGDDPRVGSLYLKAGTAYGGPCYPRDSRALEIVFERARVPKTSTLSLREVVDVTNDAMTEHLWRIVEREAGDEGVVGVLGLAYKPGTSVCEESASLDLIDHLLMNPQRRVVVYDPLAMDEARTALGCAVDYADSPQDCVAKSDVVVLMFPDAALVPMNAYTREKTLVDPWRAAPPPVTVSVLVKYIPLGVGK
jgi:UDPglucose 6-dehydrogenase